MEASTCSASGSPTGLRPRTCTSNIRSNQSTARRKPAVSVRTADNAHTRSEITPPVLGRRGILPCLDGTVTTPSSDPGALPSPFTMQAIETELETAEFEALWLQARCYEGCVSVGLVRVAIRRVDELRRLAAELARGRVVNGALFWRDPCATAVAGN